MAEVNPGEKTGRPLKGSVNNVNTLDATPKGNSKAYSLNRLKRERSDLFNQVIGGNMWRIFAKSSEAGFFAGASGPASSSVYIINRAICMLIGTRAGRLLRSNIQQVGLPDVVDRRGEINQVVGLSPVHLSPFTVSYTRLGWHP